MWRSLRSVRVLAGLIVLGALVAVAVWPRSIEIETARAETGPLVVTIDEQGRTRVRDRFVVTSPVAGEVLRITLEPGDPVQKGRTVLAVVRPAAPMPLDTRTRAEATAAVQAADAAVGRATAEQGRARTALTLAARQFARTESLARAGAVSREVLDAHEADLRAAEDAVRATEFGVAQAEHERAVARARLAPADRPAAARDWTIVAPVDGVVLARHRESQTVVPAGDPLLEIGDPSRLEIVADLLSTEAVRIAAGSEVLVEQWGGPETLQGRVRRVEPAGFTKISALGVEEQRVNVVIDFDADTEAARALGDQYRVEVRIVVWRGDSVLTVPTGSLFRDGDRWAVYVVEAGRARRLLIDIGQRTAQRAQVTAGLDAGATVVVYPPDTLTDGARVVER